ncbi:MAG: sugar ABC transporter permease, partial [Anaerolineae bacterium]|nr:sugar ABC transporter permease [Anaerolineae bacterium]
MSAIPTRVLPRTVPQTEADMRRRKINKWLFVAGFVLPGMIIFFLFFIMPISQSFYFSVFDWDGFGPPTDFIGLGNFERLLQHGVFQAAVEHSFVIMI